MRFSGSMSGFRLVIVDNTDVVRLACLPRKDDSPLVIDADAVETSQVSAQRFKPVARRTPQIIQTSGLLAAYRACEALAQRCPVAGGVFGSFDARDIGPKFVDRRMMQSLRQAMTFPPLGDQVR